MAGPNLACAESERQVDRNAGGPGLGVRERSGRGDKHDSVSQADTAARRPGNRVGQGLVGARLVLTVDLRAWLSSNFKGRVVVCFGGGGGRRVGPWVVGLCRR